MIELALELVEDLDLVQVTHFARSAAPPRTLNFPSLDEVGAKCASNIYVSGVLCADPISTTPEDAPTAPRLGH